MRRKAVTASSQALIACVRLGKITTQNTDLLMSCIKQHIHRAPRRSHIVRRHARQVAELHLVRPVRDQYAGYIDSGKFLFKIVGITAEEQ